MSNIFKLNSSIGGLIKETLSVLEENNFQPKTIQIDVEKDARTWDLFTLGKLLSFIHGLSKDEGINTTLHFGKNRAKKFANMETYGFFDYCKTNGIEYEKPDQPIIQMKFDFASDVLKKEVFSYCLIPFTKVQIDGSASNEEAIMSLVEELLITISESLRQQLAKINKFDYNVISLELSQILFSFFKELISNTLLHSQHHTVIYAATLNRSPETFITDIKNKRLKAGEDYFDILIMDLGNGIFKSVSHKLDIALPEDQTIVNKYFANCNWKDEFSPILKSEQSLLESIFRGDLIIRKGRRSEGLNEIAHAISWFDGIFTLRTGRSEIDVTTDFSEDWALIPNNHNKKQHYFLSGVIVNLKLKSTQTKYYSIDHLTPAHNQRYNLLSTANNKFYAFEFEFPSKGLSGGLSRLKTRRRSEMDAIYLAEQYMLARTSKQKEIKIDAVFGIINLKLSESIDINFLDSFIQELSKINSGHLNDILQKIVFINVPKHIIFKLRKRNCHTFLKIRQTFCLLLDELDQPHFLGVAGLINKSFNLKDILCYIYKRGTINSQTIQDILKINKDSKKCKPIMASNLLLINAALKSIIKPLQDNNIFYKHNQNGVDHYHSFDIQTHLNKKRTLKIADMKKFSIREQGRKYCFRLRNGQHVNTFIDFCIFWSDTKRLLDCTKLLLYKYPFPSTETIVSFMDNGDRLAYSIRRFTKANTIVIVDPHNKNKWRLLTSNRKHLKIVIVVDAIYPGDNNGYIADFIKTLRSDNSMKLIVDKIYAFVNFSLNPSNAKEQNVTRIEDVDIVSLDIPDLAMWEYLPKVVKPELNDNALSNLNHYILPKPCEDDNDKNNMPYKFSRIEFSTEFWHIVSNLKIVDTISTGREERNVLFFENNEIIIQNQLTRKHLNEFIINFIKSELNFQIDVIIHPSHSVGSYIAQFIANQVMGNPLIFPLTQRQYGGNIEFTLNDYLYFEKETKKRQEQVGRKPYALIVDDSVLSGKSLFTMLGFINKINLHPTGVLVLLNRLSPEISESLNMLGIKFGYLYRLHMPVLTDDQSPDKKFAKINDTVLQNTSSYFARLWAEYVLETMNNNSGSYFLNVPEKFNSNQALEFDPLFVEQLSVHHSDGNFTSNKSNYESVHIIKDLILHPEGEILDFFTRVCITYNFLEKLVIEDKFWGMLEHLFDAAKNKTDESVNIQYLRKIVFILSFSNFIEPYDVFTKFQHFCCRVINSCLENNWWESSQTLTTQCIMALGIIGSEHIFKEAISIYRNGLPDILVIKKENNEYSPSSLIIGSLSWAIRVFMQQKRLRDFPYSFDSCHFESLFSNNDLEYKMIFMDMFEPLLSSNTMLKKRLGIKDSHKINTFIREIRDGVSNNDAEMIYYLKDTPGYYCTLSSILVITKADAIFLYAKNEGDDQYYLRNLLSRTESISLNNIEPEFLEQEYFKQNQYEKIIFERMNHNLFFVLNDEKLVQQMNVELKMTEFNRKYLWFLGGAVHPKNLDMEGLKYYVILAYKQNKEFDSQITAFYYWLQAETILKDILPAINSKFVASSSAWNTVIQSLGPIHNSDNPVDERRKILIKTLSYIDMGNLLKRMVSMTSNPYSDPQTFFKFIEDDIGYELENKIILAKNECNCLKSEFCIDPEEPDCINDWPLEFKDNASDISDNTCFNYNQELFNFIMFGSLFNALAYYGSYINITSVLTTNSNVLKKNKSFLHITIENDIDEQRLKNRLLEQNEPIGIKACNRAAMAGNGLFKTRHEYKNNTFIVDLFLPIYIVPDKLKERINESRSPI